jgi:hypothetical protein
VIAAIASVVPIATGAAPAGRPPMFAVHAELRFRQLLSDPRRRPARTKKIRACAARARCRAALESARPLHSVE